MANTISINLFLWRYTLMNQYIQAILNNTDYNVSCRGLNQKDSALSLVKPMFESENISLDNWKVSEIPVADNSGLYPVAVVVCMVNQTIKRGFSLDFNTDGKAISICPDELCNIEVNTIAEAIAHKASKF